MCPTTLTPGWWCSASIIPTAKSRATRPRPRPKPSSRRAATYPRLFRNTLVFLAADKTRLQDLDEAARKYLAWESILAEKVALNLDPQQVKQAETQKLAADGTVTARLPETYQWLLVPVQATPQTPVAWQALRLTGQDALAVRAGKKLRSDDLLVTTLAGTMLRMWLDKIPLWRGEHVTVRQLVEDFASYAYLPRLKDATVLLGAIRAGVALLTWEQDSFAFADSLDEGAGRYRGLQSGQQVTLADASAPGLLVKPAVARKQLEAERVTLPAGGTPAGPVVGGGAGATAPGPGAGPTGQPPAAPPPAATQPKRYHGTVTLDATRVGRDASRIADEVIAHLAGLVGATVTVTLEIEAEVPAGAPDHVVRTVTENGRTLKFTSRLGEGATAAGAGAGPTGQPPAAPPPAATQPKRYHGTVTLDATRVGRDASRIADEVIAHLAGLVGATVTVTLEIEAEVPAGAPDHVVRTVTENGRTLKFTSQGFERE